MERQSGTEQENRKHGCDGTASGAEQEKQEAGTEQRNRKRDGCRSGERQWGGGAMFAAHGMCADVVATMVGEVGRGCTQGTDAV